VAGSRAIRHSGGVTESPDVRHSGDAKRFIDSDATVVVDCEAELAQLWVGNRSRCPDEGARADDLARGQRDALWAGFDHARRWKDLDAAPCELALRIGSKRRRNLGEDRRRDVDEDEPRFVFGQRGLAADHAPNEGLCLGQGFDARVAAADKEEGELAPRRLAARGERCELEPPQDMVS